WQSADGDPLRPHDPAPGGQAEPIAPLQGELRDRDDTAPRVAVRCSESAKLLEIPVGGVQAGLGLKGTPGSAVERLVSPDQHAREGPLTRKGGVLALDEEDLPGAGDWLVQADGEEDDVHGHHSVRLEPGRCGLGLPVAGCHLNQDLTVADSNRLDLNLGLVALDRRPDNVVGEASRSSMERFAYGDGLASRWTGRSRSLRSRGKLPGGGARFTQPGRDSERCNLAKGTCGRSGDAEVIGLPLRRLAKDRRWW